MHEAVTTAEWIPEDTFGTRLAMIRARMGWNIREAAQACDLSDVSWKRWEHGERVPRNVYEVARKIARTTGCSYTWLIAGGDLARSRCFGHLRPVTAIRGQMILDFEPRPQLRAVRPMA